MRCRFVPMRPIQVRSIWTYSIEAERIHTRLSEPGSHLATSTTDGSSRCGETIFSMRDISRSWALEYSVSSVRQVHARRERDVTPAILASPQDSPARLGS